MKEAFADTYYFIALLDPDEPDHGRVVDYRDKFKLIVASDFVLIETLNYFSRGKRELRQKAAEFVQSLQHRLDYHIVPCSREQFDEALRLYIDRPDKDWSLTDCSSFLIMQELGIDAALTADRHFVQAGLDALLVQ